MLNFWVSSAVYSLEALIYYVFFSRISSKKFAGWKCAVIGLGLFEIGSILNIVLSNSLLANTISMICIITLYAWLCFEISLKSAFLYCLIIDGLNFAMELIMIFAVSTVMGIPAASYQNNLSVLFIEALTCKSGFFILCLLLSNFVCKSKTQNIPPSLFIYPICVSACLSIAFYICFDGTISERGQLLLAGTSTLLLISLIFLFNTFQKEVEKDVVLAKTKAENAHLKTEKEYYDILERQNQNLMVYAHDARKHMTAIRELSQDPRIMEYVDNLCGRLNAYTKACHSGNKLLDVMMDRYVLDAELKGLSFTYNVKDCPLLGLEDLDLVAILGNLMDNAFTAAGQSAAKQVRLTTSVRNRYNVIVLKNSCDTPPISQGEKLLSTKEQPRFHGYGLESVARTAKKYQGDQYWSYNKDECVFTMTVILQQME